MEAPIYVTAVVDFVRTHQDWAAPVVFLLAFCESLAFLSLLLPSTAILIGISGLIGAAGIDMAPLWLAGGVGGVMGYSISYMIGAHYRETIFSIWPFRSRPGLVDKSKAFFDKYGAMSVFIGHFIGPVRAVIPVIAGSCGLARYKFEIANVVASFLWITLALYPAYFVGSNANLISIFGSAR